MNKLAILIPIGLGIAAGVFNFLAVRSSIKPLELVAVNDAVKSGTPVTASMLTPLSVRADKDILRSAIPWDQRGVILGRKINREIMKNELILFTDVRLTESDVKQNLRDGEASLTVAVPAAKVVPGVRIGDDVVVLIQAGKGDDDESPVAGKVGVRAVGPFRIIGFGEPTGSGANEARVVVLAIKLRNGEIADQGAADLEAATRGRRGDKSPVLGIEYPYVKLGK